MPRGGTTFCPVLWQAFQEKVKQAWLHHPILRHSCSFFVSEKNPSISTSTRLFSLPFVLQIPKILQLIKHMEMTLATSRYFVLIQDQHHLSEFKKMQNCLKTCSISPPGIGRVNIHFRTGCQVVGLGYLKMFAMFQGLFQRIGQNPLKRDNLSRSSDYCPEFFFYELDEFWST